MANVSLAGMYIGENTATGASGGGDGGGITAFAFSILGMQDMIFADNKAKQGGGGVSLQLARVALAKNLTFLRNQAKSGGGMQIVPSGDLRSNMAAFGWFLGGFPPASVADFMLLAAAKGLAQYPALPTVCELCTFIKNNATADSGGLKLFVYGTPPCNSSTTVLKKLLVDGNAAPQYGGISIKSGKELAVAVDNSSQ
jgi:hypothetical protein